MKKTTGKKGPALTALLLLLLLCTLLSACAAPGTGSDVTSAGTEPIQTEAPLPPAPTELALAAGGDTSFVLVRPDNAPEALVKSFSNLKTKLGDATGAKFGVQTDWVKPGDELPADTPEILVGKTNRPETAAVLDTLPADSYAVAMSGSRLVIVGTDDNLTVLALYDFEERILRDPARCSDGKLTFAAADNFTVTLDDPYTLDDMLTEEREILASGREIIHCGPQGEYNVGQGACSDGTYAYFVLRNSNDTGCVICKYLLADRTEVAVSKKLPLGHGSDVTYDSKNNLLVVAHGNTEGKTLTLVDPETLTLKRNVAITAGAGAITYNAELDRYAIGQAGTSLHYLDADFKLLKSYTRTSAGFDNAVGAGYITQGLGSDDRYLYFPMNMTGNTENILVAYDWNGKYVGTVKVPIAIESESMFACNGDYYMAFYKSKSGEYLYKLDFGIIYK